MGICGIESNLSERLLEKVRGAVMFGEKDKTVIVGNEVFRDMPLGYGKTEDFVVTNYEVEEVAKNIIEKHIKTFDELAK